LRIEEGGALSPQHFGARRRRFQEVKEQGKGGGSSFSTVLRSLATLPSFPLYVGFKLNHHFHELDVHHLENIPYALDVEFIL
jgi:hypothetical protein